MSVKEVRGVADYNNMQLRAKINKLMQKGDNVTPEEKTKLDQLKKEAWRRGMDDVV